MLPVTLASACIGFVSSGSIIWLPTYVADTRIIPANFAGAVAGLVPLLGGAGVLLSHWLVRRVRLITHVVMLMLALTIAALCLAAALPVPAQAWALALAMVLVSGATGITLSAIPVMTAQAGRTSSAAGSLSAANSVGGGLAGVIVGLVVQGTGWAAVFVAWAFGLALAMGFIYWYGRSMAAAPAH
jgi:predicted MFS family arabinose efflux permease